MGRVARSAEIRFWEKVRVCGSDECWPWLAGLSPDGYGKFKEVSSFNGKRGKTVRSHRFVWELANQASILPGYQVLHKCDNRVCCNPAHLFLGTADDNIQDMVRKGRQRGPDGATRSALYSGERHPRAKMTARKAETLRAFRQSGFFSTAELAKIYGVSLTTAKRVVAGKTY